MTSPAEPVIAKILRAALFFIATSLLYLGVTLAGWGLLDLVGYFSLSQRLAYAVVVGLFSLLIGIQAYGSTAGIRGGKGEQAKFVFRERVISIGMVIFLYLALFFIPFFDRRGLFTFDDGSILRWIGVIFAALGYMFVFWSGLILGKQYSADVTIQANHQLITASIYRLIRHPRYLGILLLSPGIALVFRSWIGLVASVLMVAVVIFRIGDEEAVLLKEFGGEWEAYCKSSWRLIPYIY